MESVQAASSLLRSVLMMLLKKKEDQVQEKLIDNLLQANLTSIHNKLKN